MDWAGCDECNGPPTECRCTNSYVAVLRYLVERLLADDFHCRGKSADTINTNGTRHVVSGERSLSTAGLIALCIARWLTRTRVSSWY